MISHADTNKMKGISKDILSSANELESLFNQLFNRFSNVPNGTGEWFGIPADRYFGIVAQDKQQYTAFLKNLRSVGNKISSDADKIQARIDKINSK